MSLDRLPKIVVSSGDPAGIGPEITVKALDDKAIRGLASWIVVGEDWVLDRSTSLVSWQPDLVTRDLETVSGDASIVLVEPNAVERSEYCLGSISANCGSASLQYVTEATKLCLRGHADGIVTAPINKEAVSLSGIQFTGHTEYIAELCGAAESRMLLVNDKMRVVHVTTHCALEDVSKIDSERVRQTIKLGYLAMRQLGWDHPRIAVCGMNPHAGENGLFGDQEATIIKPAIEAVAKLGIDCSGPFPADTLFLQAYRGKYDLIVAMYHDQGHIPMKLMDFEHTVNVSLGLPIVRTSVDHGTAFDIAGRDMADPEDMKSAMRLAVKLVRQQQDTQVVTKES